LKVLFVEPPKDFWFILGQYIPPPFGILTLAGYLEKAVPEVEVDVIDSQAEGLDWDGLEKRIEAFKPDLVAPSGMSTANAFLTLRTAQLSKSINPATKTVLGGQHFTALSEETLRKYSEIDYIVRGEGEETLAELVRSLSLEMDPIEVRGIALRSRGRIQINKDRPFICDLDTLPYPAYHLVARHMKSYYFSLMAKKETPFAIVEGSRGCSHECSYCSQSPFWKHSQRRKTPKRIADELEHLNNTYGSSLFWLTDDYFRLDTEAEKLAEEIIRRGLKISWFCQARCDDIVKNRAVLQRLKESGCVWMLVGFDTPSPGTLLNFRREGINSDVAREAVNALRENKIFSQGTFIIGERKDSKATIEALRKYADWLDPDIATFMALTPYPGTEIYDEAVLRGWLEDENWAHYDMVHAIMPTENLTRGEVQEELYRCYDEFFGNWSRRFRGMGSENPYTRRTYQYLARQAIMTGLRSLF
jgi:anaerobic magnesium-protoporphyrin IX monomethyl ester cyclase